MGFRPDLSVAVQQILWRIDHKAAVDVGDTSIKAATELRAIAEPRVDADTNEVRRAAVLAARRSSSGRRALLPAGNSAGSTDEPSGIFHNRQRFSVRVGIDVIEATELLSTTTRQTRIRRRGHAVGAEIGR